MYGEGESRVIWIRDADSAKDVPFVFRNLKIFELWSIFEDDRWHHFGYTQEDGIEAFYIDGVKSCR